MAENGLGRSKADGVLLLERALQGKQLLEERRLAALNDVLVNEWGESLDAMQVFF